VKTLKNKANANKELLLENQYRKSTPSLPETAEPKQLSFCDFSVQFKMFENPYHTLEPCYESSLQYKSDFSAPIHEFESSNDFDGIIETSDETGGSGDKEEATNFEDMPNILGSKETKAKGFIITPQTSSDSDGAYLPITFG
jgi:hypothetical protein